MSRTSSGFTTECIVDSLLLLLKENPIEEISILEIVERAGVNRSTYYRHFHGKTDIVRYYYKLLLDEYFASIRSQAAGMTTEEYFSGLFQSFVAHKKELLLLDRRSLSYILLEELNSRIPQIHEGDAETSRSLYQNYHIGGVFNCFCYWLKEGMATEPEVLAIKCVSFLPENFRPLLYQG